MISAGLDIGSVTTETVILNNGVQILASNILRTGANCLKAAEKSMEMALSDARLSFEDIDYIISTGYGRRNIPFVHKQTTEITCHAIGAYFLFPKTKTIIDIGGQDCKAININEKGEVIDFVMNDKCAAGTGRFLEVMANVLGVRVDELSDLAAMSNDGIKITSFCAVFAESEVVSLIGEGCKPEDIAKGINEAIAERVITLMHRIKIREDITITGGVAKNKGVVQAIEKRLGARINLPQDPQIIGALGAALIARQLTDKRGISNL